MKSPVQSSAGIRIRSKEDLNRVIGQIRKREEVVHSMQRKLKFRETRVDEAESKLKKRSDFLDAWEVSLKSKEAEIVEERDELEGIKQSLRKIGEDLLALSEKTDSVFDGLPYEDDLVDDMIDEDVRDDKKSILGFLKNKPKKDREDVPQRRPAPPRKPGTGQRKTKAPPQDTSLRESLKEKRDRLKGENLETPELEEVREGEVFACPVCGAEVSSGHDSCSGCGVELNWSS